MTRDSRVMIIAYRLHTYLHQQQTRSYTQLKLNNSLLIING